ncbi:PBSX family phage terminase large subunit (plasmid) [Candidatus Borreliella tachyglossi]|uniref:PBSX family phage terminase large subunit n=1 Tax=Candidatus Borreliella tachyglossi TaxID=1964448 RepID=A0A2S1LYJ2_9SPIR|nr:PBSX family phage terminase large subunit [Candidatus Borreliella tachyglossi]AWG43368.1 PBSX family phage terminase large subunit [Candidatus Borreliella tachyglossi]AWG43417.1 PBSX family phage terminase large subunit [Candidatus Borreliella tachyglossi]
MVDSYEFKSLRKEYLKDFNFDIASLFASSSNIDFEEFESAHLLPKQAEVLSSIESGNISKIILSGGIASGKTFLACYLFIKSLLANKDKYSKSNNNLILGNSQNSIEINVLGEMETICDLLHISFEKKKQNTTFVLIDGLRVNLYGGDKATDFKRLRGSNSSLMFINEATTLNRETIREALKRLRNGQEVAIFDTNPDFPTHFFKTDFIDKTEVYTTYNFTTYDNIKISKSFIETQETLYKDLPTYKARILLGEWVASGESIFTNINMVASYEFISPVCYIDPAFSIGGDNTAVCVLERSSDNKFYTYIYQDQRPVNDPYMLSMIKSIITTFNVNTLYIEDRDNTMGLGSVTKEFLNLRNNMNNYYRIAPIKPLSNKFNRVCCLITPFASGCMHILNFSSKSAINDIFLYKGDLSVHDDALDALANAYLLLTSSRSTKSTQFAKFRYL